MRYLTGMILAAVLALSAGQARAAEMNWSMNLTLDRATTSVVDAQAKRKVGILDVKGTATIAGEQAKAVVYVLFDYTNGTGPWQAYMTVSFADGSVLTAYGSGMTRADAQGLNSHFEAPLMVVSGSGRYAGAQGTGTMVGARAEQVGNKVTIHYTIKLNLQG